MLIEFESVINSESSLADIARLLKKIDFETSFQVRNKASVLMLLILFLRNILFRSKTSIP